MEAEATLQYEGPRQASYLSALTKVRQTKELTAPSQHIQDDGLYQKMQVRFEKALHQYRLIGPVHKQEEPEELVLRLTGIIARCDLPPVHRLPL